ncbi:MAG: phosphotransferase [Hyphomicrobiales bacterium]|nr:phosphotransferase [Hyphomicrobiales bacterium]
MTTLIDDRNSRPGGLTADDLRFTPPAFEPSVLLAFLKHHYGISGRLTPLAGERDQNFKVTAEDSGRFVVKVSSPDEDPPVIDFQIKALKHIEAVDPGLPVPRLVPSLKGEETTTLRDGNGNAHAVRLVTYVPGEPLIAHGSPSLGTIRQIGALQGRLCLALRDFAHPAESHLMPWDSLNGLVVSDSLRTGYLPPQLADACAPILEHLANGGLARLQSLPAQVIHNDAHVGNLLCAPGAPEIVTGVIDFGDIVKRPLVVDLSTSLQSLIERDRSIVETTTALVGGFEEFVTLPQEQRAVFADALYARLILTVQLMSFRAENNLGPGNELRDVELPRTIAALENMLAFDHNQLAEALGCRT